MCSATRNRVDGSSSLSRYALNGMSSHACMFASRRIDAEPLAQLEARAMYARLDGSAWHVQRLCDLFVRKLIDLAKDDDLAMLRTEILQYGCKVHSTVGVRVSGWHDHRLIVVALLVF